MSLTSPKVGGTVTIAYIIMSVLNDLRDYSMRHYSYMERIVTRKYIDLNLFHLNNIEVVYLRMSEAKTVDLPNDFVDWHRIGIPTNGRLRVLTNHDKILLPRTFADGADVGNTDDGNTIATGSIYFAPHFRNGQFVGGLYGYPGGVDDAYYRLDREMGTIVFGGTVERGEIVLEYISTGVKISGQTVIPREAAETLIAYLHWQVVENDRKIGMSTKQWKKQTYEEELAKLNFFQGAFTKENYLAMVRRHARQTIKT